MLCFSVRTFRVIGIVLRALAVVAALSGGVTLVGAQSLTLPVYRFADTQAGGQFYTIYESEKNAVIQNYNWFQYEGIGFYAYPAAQAGMLPVYRFADTQAGGHFYTIYESEKNAVIQNYNWFQYEGVGFYASTVAQAGMLPVYRFADTQAGGHFYTIYESEKNAVLQNHSWGKYEGIGFYAYHPPDNVRLGDVTSVIVNDGQYNSFPGITRLPNDHLFVVYRKGPGHGVFSNTALYYTTSSDQGRTWLSERLLYSFGTNYDTRDAEITLLRDGKLLMSFFRTTVSTNDTTAYVMLGSPNQDDTVSWGEPTAITTGLTVYSATSSKAIELVNGEILLPIYGRNAGDTYDSAAVIKSADGGLTWSAATIVAAGTATEQYNEANGVQLASGRIVLIVRHEVGTLGYARVYSDDNGATWSSPANVISTSSTGRPTVLLLGSGALFLLTRTDNISHSGYASSWDQGVTWTSFANYGNSGERYEYGSAVLQSSGSIAAIISKEVGGSAAYIIYQEFFDVY